MTLGKRLHKEAIMSDGTFKTTKRTWHVVLSVLLFMAAYLALAAVVGPYEDASECLGQDDSDSTKP